MLLWLGIACSIGALAGVGLGLFLSRPRRQHGYQPKPGLRPAVPKPPTPPNQGSAGRKDPDPVDTIIEVATTVAVLDLLDII